jgi:hypothetical protein
LGESTKECYQEKNELLKQPLSLREVKLALQALQKGKAPRGDGLPTKFFVCMWDVMEMDLLEVFNEALSVGYLCKNFNTNILCLLPKGGDKTLIKKWWPTILLGSVYKLLAKMLARRL